MYVSRIQIYALKSGFDREKCIFDFEFAKRSKKTKLVLEQYDFDND
jgi:hypothetical protein